MSIQITKRKAIATRAGKSCNDEGYDSFACKCGARYWKELARSFITNFNYQSAYFVCLQPYIVRPTVCWKLDWEELESNRQQFYALCSVLKERVSNFYALYILSTQNSKVKVRCVFIELNIFYIFNLGPVPFSQDHRSHCGFTASSNGDYILLSSRTFPFPPFWQFTTVEVYRSQGVDAT